MFVDSGSDSGGDPAALRRYGEAAIAMDDELSCHVRTMLAPTSADPGLVEALRRFATTNRSADAAVVATADRLAAADTGALLADNLGWFTWAGASKHVLSAAEAQAVFRNVMSGLYRPGSALPAGPPVRWSGRSGIRPDSDPTPVTTGRWRAPLRHCGESSGARRSRAQT